MERAVTMSEYRSISISQSHSTRRGRNREGRDEFGLQKETRETARPLGLTILPHKLEQRGTCFLGQDPIHFVRVYEDGKVERI